MTSNRARAASPRRQDVYRDATYSAATQDELRSLLASLEVMFAPADAGVAALRDVVERWDGNEPTETVFA